MYALLIINFNVILSEETINQTIMCTRVDNGSCLLKQHKLKPLSVGLITQLNGNSDKVFSE